MSTAPTGSRTQSRFSREAHSSNAGSSGTQRDRQNLDLALYHANLMKQQKLTETRILEGIEELLDFPASSNADPEHPAQDEASRVRSLLQPFQPSDYDGLIQERNINGRCGYVLCPRQHRSEGTTAKYRIIKDKDAGRGAFKVVSRGDLEKWCSDSCAKRALYIRVQMLDTPAWERQTDEGLELELYGEDDKHQGKPRLNRLTQDFDQLALERGDKSVRSHRSNTVQVEVMEREPSEAPHPPTDPRGHASVDGYVLGTVGGLETRLNRLNLDNSGEDDIMDTI